MMPALVSDQRVSCTRVPIGDKNGSASDGAAGSSLVVGQTQQRGGFRESSERGEASRTKK